LTPFIPKNVKFGLSWRSVDNVSRCNSGKVSHIQFKLGTDVEHLSGITWHDLKIEISTVKVTMT